MNSPTSPPRLPPPPLPSGPRGAHVALDLAEPDDLVAMYKTDLQNLFKLPVLGGIRLNHELNSVFATTAVILDIDPYVMKGPEGTAGLIQWLGGTIGQLRDKLAPYKKGLGPAQQRRKLRGAIPSRGRAASSLCSSTCKSRPPVLVPRAPGLARSHTARYFLCCCAGPHPTADFSCVASPRDRLNAGWFHVVFFLLSSGKRKVCIHQRGAAPQGCGLRSSLARRHGSELVPCQRELLRKLGDQRLDLRELLRDRRGRSCRGRCAAS